ncbi:MAG: hypothetical protein CK539_03025 [Flavobacteriales bacterium]|jgi:Domain of unknown function (DUF4290)|nr:MAG: hypothetical protein CK539_03025 [Flavobacteriales bacterium]
MTKESSSNSTGMQYNTSLSVMTNAEYGRSIHRMIEYCLTLEDRNERSRCASSIVRVMIILNPQMKEFAEYEHKIWDHLHIISNYKLDIDSPFPKPRPELIESKPEIVPYPKSSIRFKHYGKILEDLLKKALAETDPKAKEVFTEQLAQLMKRHYLNWNRDSVNDQLILEQLENLSEGNLKVGENFRFLHTSEILPKNAIPQNQIQHAVKKKSNNMHKKKKR